MKIGKITFYILCAMVVFVSCNKDDNNTDVIVVEERDRAEQQVIDKDSLIGYLETHYYNSSFFVGNLNPSINDLIIAELAEGETSPPIDHTLLIDAIALEVKNTVYLEVDYEYYILRLNQGGGVLSPTFADDIRVIFEGSSIQTGEVFDSFVAADEFDLTTLIKGWQLVFPQFNEAESFMANPDDPGNILYSNFGVGVMFLPSGLAFFSGTSTGTSYDNVMFEFELYQVEENDHDNDGIPSYLEDIDGDLNLANDDTDENTVPDYFDGDDDGDGTLTLEEDLEDIDSNVDSNGDGILDNDLDGDGDPTNDDTDGDGIPNYLDTDNTQSNTDDD